MFDRFRRLLWGLLTVCCLSAVFLSPGLAMETGDGKCANRALLIGVDEFVSRQSTYPSSTNNVFAMQESLQASRDPFEAIVIPQQALTSVKALTELIQTSFMDADADDVSYLYISTHGVYDVDDGTEPALLLSDGSTEERITPAQLEAAFLGIAGKKVILLDACYSGAFIGKGMRIQPSNVYFLGDDFKVITSSGAMEESWYWNTAQSESMTDVQGYQQGAFYFTQTLSQSINPRYDFYADANRDGDITLTELYNALLENHPASTPQVYPQEDDFVVFSYSLADVQTSTVERSPITNVTFSSSTLSATDQKLNLEFIALRPVRVAYQIVYQQEGQWQFDGAQLIYDDVEQFTAYGDERGAISPGRKVRTLSLNLLQGESGGYVMVQLVSIENSKLTVHAGRVIAIPPTQGDLALGVEVAAQYAVDDPKELAIFVRHAYPCQLSVSILNDLGETVRRLCHRESTRPLRITPEGSTFYWDGLDKDGQPVTPATYRIRVEGVMGEQKDTLESDPILLTPSEG